MSTTTTTSSHPSLASVLGHANADTAPAAAAPSKAAIYARAERRMRRGQRLVISGFVVAVLGIIAYCVACFSAAVNPELGSALLGSPEWLFTPTLGIIGLGTLLWLVGAFVYLNGAMDSDPAGPDLYF